MAVSFATAPWRKRHTILQRQGGPITLKFSPLSFRLIANRRPRMRFSPAIVLLAIVATCIETTANAQEEASLQMRIAARRELSVAKNNLRFYWQVDYPQQRRNIDAAIELTRMELKNLNMQLREFRPFTQFSIGQPFPLTVRSLQMCIKATELRLENLLTERNALVRFHSDEYDLLAYQVYEARQRVLDLEPPMPEAPLPPAQQQ
jgi:hypothetical protein